MNRLIGRHLSEFKRIRNRYTVIQDLLEVSLEHSMAKFTQKFPDLNPETKIFVIHSLGGSNGAIDMIDGELVFYPGIDMIAINNNFKNQTPFIHHEFFHAYHVQFLLPGEELYIKLWMEGLATFASVKLNPEASSDEQMLNTPKGLIPNTLNVLHDLLREIENNLKSEDQVWAEKYFNFPSNDPIVPPRAGYYIGYLLVEEAAKLHGIDELVKMQRPEILVVLKRALSNLKKSAE